MPVDPQIAELFGEADRSLEYALKELEKGLRYIKSGSGTACALNARAGTRLARSRLRELQVCLGHRLTFRERLEQEKCAPPRALDPLYGGADSTPLIDRAPVARNMTLVVVGDPIAKQELPGEPYPENGPRLPHAVLRMWNPETHGEVLPEGWHVVVWPDSAGWLTITPIPKAR